MNAALLAPAGLFAAISLAVILLLHIRRQTPPPHRFPSLRFWQPSESTVTDRQRFRPPPLTLPLVLQLLLALVVTLALARPALSGSLASFGARTAPRHDIVILDASSSMSARNPGEQRSRFEAGRQRALAVVDDWQSGDVLTVLLAGSSTDSRSAVNREQVEDLKGWLRAVPATGGIADLDASIRNVGNLRLPDRENQVTLITDTASPLSSASLEPLGMPIDLVDVTTGEVAENIAITSMSARQIAGTQNQFAITFTITSFASSDRDVPWIVTADDSDVATNTIFLRPGETRQVTVILPVGATGAEARLDVQDALYLDNLADIAVSGDRLGALAILVVSDTPSAIVRALQAVPGARVDLQPSSLPGIAAAAEAYDLVVFEGVVSPAAELPDRPMLFVQPGAVSGLFDVTGAVQDPGLTAIDANAALLQDVDLSGVTFGQLPLYQPAADARIAATGSDGATQAPLIWQGTVDTQPYVAFAFSIAESNLAQRVAFPILVSRAVEALVAAPFPGALSLGDSLAVPTASDIAAIEVVRPNQSTERITANVSGPTVIRVTAWPGQYTVRYVREDQSVAEEAAFIVNAGHPTESNLTPIPGLADLIAAHDADTATLDGESGNRSEFWWALAMLALGILLVEWLVSGRRPVSRRPAGGVAT